MKSTIDLLSEWASDGGTQVYAPTEAKIARGWNAGEQPPAQWENWVKNRDNAKINELIGAILYEQENETADSISDRCSGLIDSNALLNPASEINRYDAVNLVSLCRGYDYANVRECVFALVPTDSSIIKIIYNDSDGTIGTVDVTTQIPDTYDPIDICCDGYHIYVLLNIGSGDAAIYKVPIGDTYPDGISTGAVEHITLTDMAQPAKYDLKTTESSADIGRKRLIVANASNIAFLNNPAGPSPDVADPICIVTKTLTTATGGTGTAALVDTDDITLTSVSMNGICSDGSRIWYIHYGTATTYVVCVLSAVLISNPADTTADLTRSWATDPVYWAEHTILGFSDPYIGFFTYALVYDGAAVHALGIRNIEDGEHEGFDIVFDIDSEFWFFPRTAIPAGHAYGGIRNGGAAWTGRRIANVATLNHRGDLSTSGIFDRCNQFQAALTLLEPYRNGFNTGGPGDWDAGEPGTVADLAALYLDSPAVPAKASLIVSVEFAENCLWVLRYLYDWGTSALDSTELARIPTISRR